METIESMPTNPTIQQKYGNAVNLLPILYVAWADSILTEQEVGVITEEVEKQDWLTLDEKSWATKWLNPNNLPSPIDMKNWLVIIQRGSFQNRTPQENMLGRFRIEGCRNYYG